MTFFVLGSQPELSLAEIKAVLGKDEMFVHGDIAIFEDVDVPLGNLQHRLAGTIKIGSVIGSMKKWNKEDAADLIRSMIGWEDGKIQFGISAYGKELRHHAQPLGLEIKKKLKEDNVSSRLVTSKEATLSSVVVTKNQLIESGGEYVLLQGEKEMLIGQTETVQDFEAWSKRDFGRPARDAKSGMLPPKLARMMINLAGTDPNGASLLDPFCGSGTILMEAGLMGFEKLYGSDISEKAIKDSKKNLEWIAREEQTTSSTMLEVADACETQVAKTVDVIVAEPYLGPPQRGRESRQELDQIIVELNTLYRKSFVHLRTLLKPGSPMVVAFPVFGERAVVTKPLPGFELRERLRYERDGQRVARDICRYLAV